MYLWSFSGLFEASNLSLMVGPKSEFIIYCKWSRSTWLSPRVRLTRTWAVRSPDWANALLHVSHWYGFSPEWVPIKQNTIKASNKSNHHFVKLFNLNLLKWIFKWVFREKFRPHVLHKKGFSPECERKCTRKQLLVKNPFAQTLQTCVRFACVFRCCCKILAVVNVRRHDSHWCLRMPVCRLIWFVNDNSL